MTLTDRTARRIKRHSLCALFAGFLALIQPANAQEPELAEKIRDISPDKKFALQICYD